MLSSLCLPATDATTMGTGWHSTARDGLTLLSSVVCSHVCTEIWPILECIFSRMAL
jgi:hypothetical protein